MSLNAAGTSGGNASTQLAVPSRNGTKVLLTTNASNLGPADTNNAPDVYLRDLETGTTTLISANAAGTNSGNSGSSSPVFSPDETKVAFSSHASDLGPADGDLEGDIYVRDLIDGSVVRIKPWPDPCGSAHSVLPMFSPDGTKLVFVRDWWAEGLGDAADLYVHDFVTGMTTLVTAHAGGASCAPQARSWSAAFAPDGGRLAFVSSANDLGPHDSTPPGGDFVDGDVYLWDLVSGTMTLVSTNATGTDAVNHVADERPLFTPDGTHLIFTTSANGLGPTDTNSGNDVYVRDLSAGTTSLVSANADGTAAALGSQPALSPDGTKVAFSSAGNTHGPIDSDTGLFGQDIYVRDLTTGVTSLVSTNSAGTDSANSISGDASFVGDGRVAFRSMATDVVEVDTNGRNDLFIRDLAADTTTLVSTNEAGTDSANGQVQTREVSADGSTITFATTASNHGPADTNGLADVYVARYHERANLSIDLGGAPDPVPTGSELTYNVHVANTGPGPARSVGVLVGLPEGVTVVEADSDNNICGESATAPNIVICDLGALATGDSVNATLRVTVTAPAGSTLTARAVIGSPTLDPEPTDNAVEARTTVTST